MNLNGIGLTNEQWDKLYKGSIQNTTDIRWIRERLVANTKIIERYDNRIGYLERRDATLQGKVTILTLTMASLGTIIANSFLWILGAMKG